jgi:class 3 adenylate cyclase
VAAQTNNWRHYSLTLAALGCSALARGDFRAVERYGQETMDIVLRSRYPFGGAMVVPAVACAHACRGAWAVAEDALNRLVTPGQVFENPGRAFNAMAQVFQQLVRAYQDTSAASREFLTETLQPIIMQERFNQTLLSTYCALIEMCALGLLRTPVEPLSGALAQVAERGVLFSRGWMFLIPRILGLAATVNRGWEVAESHFGTAIAVATDVGARPELGRTYLDYAHMLVTRGRKGDRRRAAELAELAQSLFDELGMEPFLRRTEELVSRLRVRRPRVSRPSSAVQPGNKPEMSSVPEDSHGEGADQSLRIILVTDMVGSTNLIQRLGDAKAHQLIGMHNDIIRDCLLRHHGTEVTHTGDGIEASFQAASTAVACAVAIQRAFADLNREVPDDPMQVRIGLNAGEPMPMEGRLFGMTVHKAFRICTRARPGQILTADVVYQLCAGKGFTFIDRGRARLKGLEGSTHLYEVRWQGDEV